MESQISWSSETSVPSIFQFENNLLANILNDKYFIDHKQKHNSEIVHKIGANDLYLAYLIIFCRLSTRISSQFPGASCDSP